MDSGVDPELKAFIGNLVSALGGPDAADPSRRYKLGDDALACLRDLKKWLVLYDDKLDRWDVARAISETTLVPVDLCEILTQWDAEKAAKRTTEHQDRIAVACLELLVPLTWPLRLPELSATVNHYHNMPFLQEAHKRYKLAILTYPKHLLLKAVLRLASGPMRQRPHDRSSRDEGILKLAVYFFRNLLAIGQATDPDIGRSATIAEFERQKVLDFIVTMGAGMGRLFDTQDTAILESLYYMIKSIDPDLLFSKKSGAEIRKDDLGNLLEREKQLRASVFQPSRHSRFGTMIAMDVPGEGRLSVSGQKALVSNKDSLQHMDAIKRWHKPKRRTNDEHERWDIRVTLDDTARDAMVRFVNKFLDASFNPLFIKLRTLVEQDNDRMLEENRIHYLYMMGWFLGAERTRHQGAIDFELVGAALNTKTFIVLTNLMRRGFDKGDGHSFDLVHSSMFCFREVLMMVRDMGFNKDPEWIDTADSLKSRLFYDEHTLELFTKLARTAVKQTLDYVVECVELTHVLLKMLEEYSKQHTYVFVKAKRQRLKQKKAAAPQNEDDYDESDPENEQQEAARVTRERKFEFLKFEAKFNNEHALDMYERVLVNFHDVEDSALLHTLAFFHRFFVKRGQRAHMYRLSMVTHLVKLTSRHDGLSQGPVRNQVEQFVKYYTHKLTKALQETPCLFVELLFDKMASELHYLDHGFDKETSTRDEPAIEYDFSDKVSGTDRRIAVCVAALLDEDKRELVDWLLATVKQLVDEQQADQTRRMVTNDRMRLKTLKRDAVARLLLREIGCVYEQGKFIVPSTVTALKLVEAAELIDKYSNEPVDFEDGAVAADYIRKPGAEDEVNEYISEESASEGEGGFEDPRLAPLSSEEQQAKKRANALARKATQQRKRARRAPVPVDPGSEEEAEAATDAETNAETDADTHSETNAQISAAAQTAQPPERTRQSARALLNEQRRKRLKRAAFVDGSDSESENEAGHAALRMATQRAQNTAEDAPMYMSQKRRIIDDDSD